LRFAIVRFREFVQEVPIVDLHSSGTQDDSDFGIKNPDSRTFAIADIADLGLRAELRGIWDASLVSEFNGFGLGI